MPRAKVIAGKHRLPSQSGTKYTLGEEVPEGSIVDVSEAELFAFPDKLQRLSDGPEPESPSEIYEADFEDGSSLIVEIHDDADPLPADTEAVEVNATPSALALAAEFGITHQELSGIPGSGSEGRVIKADVEAYIETEFEFVEEDNEE